MVQRQIEFGVLGERMKASEKIDLMGKIVIVSYIYRKKSIHKDKTTERKWEIVFNSRPRAGWVVGFRNVYDGIFEYSQNPEEPGAFSPTKAVPCMMVSYWPTTLPVRVPLEYLAWELGGEPIHPNVFFKTWNETQKSDQREYMKTVSRDEKGRWLNHA